MLTHDFNQALDRGLDAEATLDRYLNRFYEVKPVSRLGQLQGSDRLLRHRDTGVETLIEIKADYKAIQTQNVFVELIHREGQENNARTWLGWAASSQADTLVLLIPQTKVCYWVPMLEVRRNLMSWNKRHPKAELMNSGQRGIRFMTQGVLVPLKAIAAISTEVFVIN